jgi:hypothetical protein
VTASAEDLPVNAPRRTLRVATESKWVQRAIVWTALLALYERRATSTCRD